MDNLKFRPLAKEIARREGKKKQEDIAQINEQLKITLNILANSDPVELVKLLVKYKNV